MNATPGQKTKIAQLCISLRIREPLEDRKMSEGEAGRLIRELLAEKRQHTKNNNCLVG